MSSGRYQDPRPVPPRYETCWCGERIIFIPEWKSWQHMTWESGWTEHVPEPKKK